ncbi:MAG: hypothetical protein M3220_04850 [Chloroflexota bacterium]|nr:hypothetical protein [Chloroflexota bacterium]
MYIPETVHQQLLERAEVTGVKMAQLVREFIVDGLERSQPAARDGVKTLEQLARLEYTAGPKDLSTNLD